MTIDLTPQEVARFRRKHGSGPGCWEWTSATNNKGYGRFSIYRGGTTTRLLAHRVAYALATGEDPGAQVVRHRCDNPPCVRPDHLELGTQGDNIRDAVVRGRFNLRGLDESRERRSAQVALRLETGLKTCPRCDETKPLTDFHVQRRNPDGRGPMCAACVNADHRNARAQRPAPPPRPPKTHCKRGHEFTSENTYTWPGRKGRACRTCAIARAKAHKRRAA